MPYVSMRIILITAILMTIWATQAAAAARCIGGEYLPGSSREANVLTVLESMRTATTTSLPNRYYTVRVENPKVYGVSSCDLSIGVDECISCLSASVDSVKSVCPRSVAARDDQGTDCYVEYISL